MKVEIGVGDFLDRYTILLLKQKSGLDVFEELKQYQQQLHTLENYQNFTDLLYDINHKLWNIENQNRKTGNVNRFTIVYNNIRSYYKKQADIYYSSNIKEIKNYENTDNG